MMANERGSRVAVVHGCFPEGGDSILSAFSWEPLPAKLQDRNSHMINQDVHVRSQSKLTIWKWSLKLKVGRIRPI